MYNDPYRKPFNNLSIQPIIAAAPLAPLLQNPPSNAAGWRTFAVLGGAVVLGIVLWVVMRGLDRGEGD